MSKDFELMHELEKLYEYLYGAHHASDNEGAQVCLHTACHKLQDIMHKEELRRKQANIDFLSTVSK